MEGNSTCEDEDEANCTCVVVLPGGIMGGEHWRVLRVKNFCPTVQSSPLHAPT